MPKKILISAVVAVCLAACASTPPTQAGGSRRSAAQQPVGCVGDTASRIPMSAYECSAAGHTWTDNDIKRTGSGNDTGQALHVLDPTMTVTGH